MPVLVGEASTGVTILEELFTLFTGWMGDIVTVITGNILFLLPIGIFCVGAAIGLARRIIGQ